MAINLTINKLRFPNNGSITNPITVTLLYKGYYDTSFIVIDTNVNVGVDGTLLDSPLPVISINPSQKYVIKAINELCGFEYEQDVIINPYCPVGYVMSEDQTYCMFEETTLATPPSNPQTAVAVGVNVFSMCGTLVYDPGFPINGNGVFTQINTAIAFWKNSASICVAGNTTDGPLNRNGVWTSSAISGQEVGFSVCINVLETKTYYVGCGFDNYGTIRLNGNDILISDDTTTENVLEYWKIYPVQLLSGVNVLEIIGRNGVAPGPNPAAIGVEIYDNTAAEILASVDYTTLNVIFKSGDYVGQPIQLGTNGFGYTCPTGYSLSYCESPVVCKKILTTPILY